MPLSTVIALVALAVTVLGAFAAVLTLRLSLNKVTAVVEQHRWDKGLTGADSIDDVVARNPLNKTRRRIRPGRWLAFGVVGVAACGLAWAVMTGYAGASTGPQHALPAHANPAAAVILIACVLAGVYYLGRKAVRKVTSK